MIGLIQNLRDVDLPSLVGKLGVRGEGELPLIVLRQDIALFRRREAALRAEAELIERDVLCRLVDARDNILLLFERARF